MFYERHLTDAFYLGLETCFFKVEFLLTVFLEPVIYDTLHNTPFSTVEWRK